MLNQKQLFVVGHKHSETRVMQQTNIGTGLRASVHMQLPNLSRDGTDIDEARSDPATFVVSRQYEIIMLTNFRLAEQTDCGNT